MNGAILSFVEISLACANKWHPVGVTDRQPSMNDAPSLPPSVPFLCHTHGELQHYQQTVLRGKDHPGFGDLAKLTIEPLDTSSALMNWFFMGSSFCNLIENASFAILLY